MTSHIARLGFLAVAAGLALTAALTAAEPIPPKQLAALHALIKPQPGEDTWAEIPWLTSLWQARKNAAAEGKPILLWEMDGNPLGCV
jgi:hypothetical protein